MPDHLPAFPLWMSTEMGSFSRLSGTCDIATIFPVGLYTGTSSGVPKETYPSAQFTTIEPVDTVVILLVYLFVIILIHII